MSERWTIDDLIRKDKLVNEKKSIKDLILEMEDEVLANAGVDVFKELFKLIFTKLYDEMKGGRDPKRHLVFKNYGDTETELKTKIQDLFDKARSKWEGVFTDDAKLQLTPSHLSVCVGNLKLLRKPIPHLNVDLEWADPNKPGIRLTNTKHAYYETVCACGHCTQQAALPGITRLDTGLLVVGMAPSRPWACGTDSLSGLPDAAIAGADTGIPSVLAGPGDQCGHSQLHFA